MRKGNNTKWLAWSILILLSIIWGSSFILIKKGLETLTPLEVGSLRLFTTFLFLLPFAFRYIRRLTKRQVLFLSIVGIIGSGIPSYLFAVAQTGINSYLAGILNSLTPIFTLLVGLLISRMNVRWYNVAGLMLGFLGAIALLSVSGGGSLEVNMKYAIYIIFATICYAINVNIIKYYLHEVKPVTITAVSFLFLGLPAVFILLFFTEFIQKLGSGPEVYAGIGYVTILGIVGTGIALIIFNRLIKFTSAIFAASVTYMIPVVALFWGIVDGEEFRLIYLVWIATILFGVFLVNMRLQNKPG